MTVPLVLGPVLRHVGDTTASVWVQLSRAATVEVLGTTARTFEVAGHHFALVPVTGLDPDTVYPYQVLVDGERVWPPSASPFPPSTLRTRGPVAAGRHRVVFGSCRYAKVPDRAVSHRLGVDALDAYAIRTARSPREQWPDVLLLLGDQVYADELTPQIRRRIAGRGDRHPLWPDDEIVGFDEYVGLYDDSWSDPEVRWLLSCVPTAMIVDDHDVRDDWNTSAAWRAQMAATPWWRARIRAGLAAYWVFQHLGNLTPEDLDADPDLARVRAAEGDTWPLLADLADRADAEVDSAKAVRFSFRWDLGRSRLVVIDSRNGRILEHGARLMLSAAEFAWVEQQADADVDHLILGTSLPWLLPPAIGDLESVNELAAARPGLRGRLGEAIRQGADLEHWAAFRTSFDRLTRIVARATRRGTATVTVLSGDVHHSYAARARIPDAGPATVHQLTCSPVHNHVEWFVRPGFRIGWSRAARRLTGALARRAGVRPPEVSWDRAVGPLFGNTIATLDIDGRGAAALFEQPRTAGSLVPAARLALTGPDTRATSEVGS